MTQEDLTITNVDAPIMGANKYTNSLITNLKTHFNNNATIAG